MRPCLFALALLLSFAVLCITGKRSDLFFKNVQGPPEEFASHTLPTPEAAALTSESTLVPVVLKKDESDGLWKWQSNVALDSSEQAAITIVSRVKSFTARFAKDGSPLAPLEGEKVESWMGWSEKDSTPATTYVIKEPQAGVYTLQLETKEQPMPVHGNEEKPTMFVLVYNQSPLQIFSHLSGDYHQLLVNQNVNMQTRMFDNNLFESKLLKMNRTDWTVHGREAIVPAPFHSRLMSAEMGIIMPDGAEEVITMYDDGLHGDANANDGVFGGSFKATQEGTYSTQVTIRGFTPKGTMFTRTTQHVFTVIENDKLELESHAAAKINTQEEMMKIYLRLTFDEAQKAQVIGQKFRAYAEVWGNPMALSGQQFVDRQQNVPVAFVTGMSIAQESKLAQDANALNVITMELQLSMKWLSKAKATLPLQLRNVYVQDAQNNIPVAKRDTIDISVDMFQVEDEQSLLQRFPINNHINKLFFQQFVLNSLTETRFSFHQDTITEEMTWGIRPPKYRIENRNISNTVDAKLVLVHGYCASDNSWEHSHFTNWVEFEDLRKSRTHDEFALLLGQFGDQFPAYSIAAHSQGGPASLHLKTFYWSNQDGSTLNDDDHRDIQTVGSPYRGNALAGTLASIGEFLGFGCGPNYDLTKDGAQLWLTSIPMSSRSHVYYYTTQYKDWKWCNLAANFVLSWPNDGTAEYKYSNLEKGNNMGHVKGQCHSLGMKYLAQTHDQARNTIINQKASRGL